MSRSALPRSGVDARALLRRSTPLWHCSGRKGTRDPSLPFVLSTAHPAKFPDAVKAACGFVPALPDRLADLAKRKERVTVLPADQAAVERYVTSVSRAAREGAAA
jgi:threonine synthase